MAARGEVGLVTSASDPRDGKGVGEFNPHDYRLTSLIDPSPVLRRSKAFS